MKRQNTLWVTVLVCVVVMVFILPMCASADEKTPSKYGTVTGQMRFYYFTQRNKTTGSDFDNVKESLAFGGYLKYETPWLNEHFGAGAALYGTAPVTGELNKIDHAGTGLLDSKNRGFFALGEAYVKARFMETEMRLWRQRLETPYINAYDSRMIPKTFEAYGLKSQYFENAVISLYWVDKEKDRDTELFKSMSEYAGVQGKDRGVLMGGVDWTPMKVLPTRFWNYYAPDIDNTFFTQAKYTFDVSEDLAYTLLVQGADQRSQGKSYLGHYSTGELGLMGGVKAHGVTFELGGTIVNDTVGIRNSWGANPFFTNMLAYSYTRAGEKALYLGAGYDFSRIGLKAFTADIKTVFGRTPNTGNNASFDRDEYNLNLGYAFDGDLKGFSISNRWSYQDADARLGGKDGFQVRLRCQYDFQLL